MPKMALSLCRTNLEVARNRVCILVLRILHTVCMEVGRMSKPHGVWLDEWLTAGPPIADRYEALCGQIPAVLYIDRLDDDETTLYVNPQIEQILGISLEDYVNPSTNIWRGILHPDERDEVLTTYHALLGEGGGELEYRLIRPDNGDEVWIHDRFVVLGSGDNAIVQGLMLDITDRKRSEAVIGTQLRMLERAEQVGKTFTDIVVNRGDITHILRVLSDLVGNPVLLVDNTGQISALADAGLGSNAVYELWEVHAPHEHQLGESDVVAWHRSPETTTASVCLWQNIRIRDETWGRLHVIQSLRDLDEIDALAVDRAVAALGLALLVERETGYLTESARSGLISDLARDGIGSGMEFLRRSRSLGVDLGRGDVAVVVMEPSGPEPHTERNRHLARIALLRRSRAALAAAGWRALSALEGERVVAVLAVPTGTDFRSALASVADPSYRVGVSDVVDFGRVPRAYQQAAEAVSHAAQVNGGELMGERLSAPIVHFEDLGLTHLLSTLAEGPDLARFVDVELGPLVGHDRTQGSSLIPTLRAFLAEHGSKTAAAKRLHVERRTVYYRLDRIASLLGRDLDNTEARLRLDVALRGLDLIAAHDRAKN